MNAGSDLIDPCIVHPALFSIDNKMFSKVVQYLIEDSYSPKASVGVNTVLYRIEATRDAYSNEVIKAGRVYVFAKQFQITALAEHVFEKVNNHRALQVHTGGTPLARRGHLRTPEFP